MEASEDILIADKLLFAVDLVDHIIITTRPSFGNKTVDILERVDRIRNYTYNRFNKTIKMALHIIDVNQDASVFSDFQKMMDENNVNKQSFIEYANIYRERKLSDGFHAKPFLMYCDRVANMAGYFLSYGIDDAPDAAVDSIMQAFPQSVMYNEHWSKITKVAEVLEVLGSDYYGGLTDGSSSESNDPSENEGSNAGSVDMDVNVCSPEDVSEENLDAAPSTLEKSSVTVTNVDPVSKSGIELEEAMICQSSDSACSSVIDVSHRNLDIASSILEKTKRIFDERSGSSIINVDPVTKSDIESDEAMTCQSYDSAYSSIVSSIKYLSDNASPASPEEVEMSNNAS